MLRMRAFWCLTGLLLTSLGVATMPAIAVPPDPDMYMEAEGASASASNESDAGTGESKEDEDAPPLSSATLSGLKLRCIGPALTSGRIGDFAVDPNDPSYYFVAVCSGGVWKTTNAGTTYEPVFDGEGSYSIGCVTLDPHNRNVVWVGSGENNSQRSVSFGDGVYRSRDGGKSWENLGLKESEHIGMIAIDPRDSNVVYVAAQGPLWRSGGDRGLYKTTDGGKSWERVLFVSDDTGVNEVHLDPRYPDTLYATSYQRRRHTWTLIDGGPESAIYKSEDAGKSWRKLTSGIPTVDKGRIGLDIAPANPDVIYAVIEAANGKGGTFRSTDRGETWDKRSDYVSGGPQYYNEIVCDPIDVDTVFALDTFMHVTTDGGKSFQRAPRKNRHVDDHALWINPHNTQHMLVGCDGGIYETHDRGEHWAFKANLPVTQFYRVAIDNAEPFYFVYGGTQDNNTLGGPSRTRSPGGIANEDWFITVGGDGFETQVDPTDPNIVYSEWQYGGLIRFDRTSGEQVDIKPREKPDDAPNRWNWDSPLLISPHDHNRLYFASQRLYRSDDRGDSWRAISGDLTRQLDRDQLKVMGRIWSIDAVAKNSSTSFFGNCVALSESPLVDGLIYVGTDDGLIQVTSDGGQTWRKIEEFPGVPEMSYVTCVQASMHDADTVYACFDNHKMGDFAPYILKSTDRGQTWTSIRGDLPEKQICHVLREDGEKADLLFLGTEYGLYTTLDGGAKWLRLKGGMPTVAIRDIEIQRRENDVVCASFGRGFYILDDYTPLRQMTAEQLEQPAVLYPVPEALSYQPVNRLQAPDGIGFQGASFYTAPNPPYGAVFTYYLKDKLLTRTEQRHKAEKEDEKAERDVKIPSVEELRAEDEELPPAVLLVVRDEAGDVVRRIDGSREKGIHRDNWDLRYPVSRPISLKKGERAPWEMEPAGPMVLPGDYTVELVKVVDGKNESLAGPEKFSVVPLQFKNFADVDRAAALDFYRKVARLRRAATGASRLVGELETRMKYLRAAASETPGADLETLSDLESLRLRLATIERALRGDSTRSKRDMPTSPSIVERIENIVNSQWYTSAAPTQTQMDDYGYAADAFGPVLADLKAFAEQDLPAIEQRLEAAGAPWTPGRVPTWEKE